MSVPGLNGTHAWAPGAGGLSPFAADGAASGVILNERKGAWPRFKLSAIPGLRSRREAEYLAAAPVGRSGELPRRVIARGKTVVYDGTIRARTLLELEDAIDRLEAAFAGNALGTMTVGTLLHSAAFSSSRNRVANSSFESGMAPWLGAGATIAAVAGGFHEATACRVLKASTGREHYLYQSFDTPRESVIEGQTITVSAYVKRGAFFGGVRPCVQVFNGVGTYVGDAGVNGVLYDELAMTGWTRVSATLKVEYGWGSVAPLIQFVETRGYLNNGDGGDRFVDAVQIEDGATLTAYSPSSPSTYQGPFRYRATCTALDVPEEHPPEIAQHRATRGFERRFTLALRLPDPRFYGRDLRSARGSASAAAPLSATNRGTAPTDPVLRIYGTIPNPTVTNQAGRTIAFTGTVPSFAFLEVDFTARTSTVVNGNVRSAGLPVNRAASTWWNGDTPGLLPGVNTLTLGGDVGGVRDLQADWYDAWGS